MSAANTANSRSPPIGRPPTVPSVFVETVRAPRAEIEFVFREARLTSDPPPGLRAAISWELADGEAMALVVWDSPGERGDWAAERVVPLADAGAMADHVGHPERATPIEVWVRSG